MLPAVVRCGDGTVRSSLAWWRKGARARLSVRASVASKKAYPGANHLTFVQAALPDFRMRSSSGHLLAHRARRSRETTDASPLPSDLSGVRFTRADARPGSRRAAPAGVFRQAGQGTSAPPQG